MSLAMVGGASAAVAPTANVPWQGASLTPITALGESEVSDMSLATFCVFDKELAGTSHRGQGGQFGAGYGCRPGGQFAAGYGCRPGVGLLVPATA